MTAYSLTPYAYLRYIFGKLPLARTLEDYGVQLPRYLTREQLAVPNLVVCG
ncbi:MAG TPA: transposase domain-containing protein [Desulfobulbus sp.]|nr:transposase domain-containing protein [Desulfobulbus sp.]